MSKADLFDYTDYLEFEKTSNIFSIRNDKNIYLWDIFRSDVFDEWYFNSLQRDKPQKKLTVKKVSKLFRISNYIGIFKAFLFLFFNKKTFNNFFYLATRNQYKESFIDQNCYDIYQTLTGEKNLLFESFRNNSKGVNTYKDKLQFAKYYKILIKLLYHPHLSSNDKECIKNIVAIVNTAYPIRNLQITELEILLVNFYRDVFLYKKLFTNHSIKKVFLSQNGYQKGMFYAAKKMNVAVCEFQHGVIRKEHLAYSYPEIRDIQNYLCIPENLLTFSAYWTSLFYCPIKSVVLGNNYFSKEVVKTETPNAILVISAFSFGHQLADCILSACKAKVFNENKVVFKLHPHEYEDRKFYENLFQDDNVEVITDEYSVNTLLANAKLMITVNSTAVYEALQSNTRVGLYAIPPYEQMEPLFTDKNLFLFNNIEELKAGMNAELPADYKAPVFFEKCTPEKIEAALKINE